MGVDYMRSKAKAFVKAWGNNRADLARLGLFTREPGGVTQSVIARAVGPVAPDIGDPVNLRVAGDRMVALVGIRVVAESVRATDGVMVAVRNAGGYAQGHVSAAAASGLIEIEIQ